MSLKIHSFNSKLQQKLPNGINILENFKRQHFLVRVKRSNKKYFVSRTNLTFGAVQTSSILPAYKYVGASILSGYAGGTIVRRELTAEESQKKSEGRHSGSGFVTNRNTGERRDIEIYGWERKPNTISSIKGWFDDREESFHLLDAPTGITLGKLIFCQEELSKNQVGLYIRRIETNLSDANEIYKGLGSIFYQVTVERCLMLGLHNLRLQSIWGSAGAHMKAGFIPTRLEKIKLIEEAIDMKKPINGGIMTLLEEAWPIYKEKIDRAPILLY